MQSNLTEPLLITISEQFRILLVGDIIAVEAVHSDSVPERQISLVNFQLQAERDQNFLDIQLDEGAPLIGVLQDEIGVEHILEINLPVSETAALITLIFLAEFIHRELAVFDDMAEAVDAALTAPDPEITSNRGIICHARLANCITNLSPVFVSERLITFEELKPLARQERPTSAQGNDTIVDLIRINLSRHQHRFSL